MARTIKERFHRPLPGGGFDSNGNPRQGKVEVRGVISVSTYSVGGESLAPSDIGLKTIDWIDIRHEEQAGGKEGSEKRDVRYNFATQDFYIVEQSGGVDTPANAGAHELRYNAFGDTLRDAELL